MLGNMYLKIHESYRKVVGLCDSELVGKKFEEGKKQLDVTEHFFKGEEVTHDEAVVRLRQLALDDATFNVVGQEAVKAAIEAGVLGDEGVGEVSGVKFGLVLL
jgi:hypothetical protein